MCEVEKEERREEVDKCGLILNASDKDSKLYVDNGFSRHMKWDKIKFVSLHENKNGNVTFRKDEEGRIRGNGTIMLHNVREKAQDALFVDGMKHNLLSVSQICDRGYDVLLRAQDCEIRSTTTRNVLPKGHWIENNVYILKEDNEECYINKQDESWLWHRIFWHLNFDCIIRLSKKRSVRDLPKIKKPQNPTCK